MAGIQPIARIANEAVAAPIAVDASHCVASRHRAATCRACVDACGQQALRFEQGRILVDNLACNGCLACVPACPTEAISVVGQNDQGVSVSADVALENAGGVAVYACHRAMDRSNLDLSAIVSVPCLASIDESLLCEQASRGAYQISLVDAGCAGCPRVACQEAIDVTVQNANALLALCDANLTVERMREFPAEVLREPEPGYDASKRFMFTQAGHMVGSQVLKAVDTRMDAASQGQDEAARIDPMSTFAIDKRMRLLNAIDAMGVPADGTVQTRSFHTLEVDSSACSGCGVCAMFCPTGALRFDANAGGILEWSAAECSGCGMCRDICAKRAISVVPGVACAELFDFEPRELWRGRTSVAAHSAHAPLSWEGATQGSLAQRFFAGGRAVDPAVERMRAQVGTLV